MFRFISAFRAGAVMAALATAAPALAQLDTATLIGTITDAQGAVLPGTTITARNTASGFIRATTAGADGGYRLAALTPGTYEVTAELQGFTPIRQQGVTLALGAQVVLNMTLQLGTLTEAVTVTAEVPIVETTTSVVQTTLNREQIDLLPIISSSRGGR